MSWKQAGDLAFFVATGITVFFAICYFLGAPWWKTVAGRNIMSVMGTMALAFSYFTWAIAVGGIPPGFDTIRALLFIGIALAVGWRTVIFIRHHLLRSLREPDGEGDNKNELEDAR